MTQRYHSTHEDLAMLPANDGVYVLFCDYEALRTELAQCQRERDEARMSLDNRQQEVDRLILEQSHTYAVEIPELEQQLAQCQRERDALRGELQQSYKIVGGYDKPITQAIQGKLAQARRMVWEECIEYWSKECSLFGPVVAWCREQSAKEQP